MQRTLTDSGCRPSLSPVPPSPIVVPQPHLPEEESQPQIIPVAIDGPPQPFQPESLEPSLPPIVIPKKFRAASPTPSTSVQPSTHTRSTTAQARQRATVSTRGSLPARYPSPPPQDTPLGPAAQYPYIPDDEYSCRPGGPKIYDLLNSLPLEPFGVLSWMIIDREEELFELDDVRDEDKVMMALWNRWIILNR